MKSKLILLISMLFAIVSHSQTITTFQNQEGHWGLKKDNKEIVSPKYTSVDSTSFNSISFFKDKVLALVVSEYGDILFHPSNEILNNSNAYIHYYIKETKNLGDDFKSKKEELDNSLFLYLSDAIIDTTIVRIDTIFNDFDIKNIEEGYQDNPMIAFGIVHLKEGDITLVNGKGKSLRNDKIQNIYISEYDPISNLYDEDYTTEHFYEILVDDMDYDEYGYHKIFKDKGYTVSYLFDKISPSNICIKQDGKWGLIDIDGKELVKPIYDTLIPGTKRIEFYNNNVLSAIVDTSGDYLFKADDKVILESNAFVKLVAPRNESNTMDIYKDELERTTFLYLNNAVLDRVVLRSDTASYWFNNKEFLTDNVDEYVSDQVICRLKEGNIRIVNSRGELYDKDNIDNIDNIVFRYWTSDPESNSEYKDWYYHDLKIENNKFERVYSDSYDNYLGYEHIDLNDSFFLFEINNKWGVYDIYKGEVLPANFDKYEYDEENETTSFYTNDLLVSIINNLGEIIYEVDKSIIKKSKSFFRFNYPSNVYDRQDDVFYMYLSSSTADSVVISDGLEFYNYETDTSIDSIVDINHYPLFGDAKIFVNDSSGEMLGDKSYDNVYCFINKKYYNSELYYINNKYTDDELGRLISVNPTANEVNNNKYYFINVRGKVNSNLLLAKRKNKWFVIDPIKGKEEKASKKLVNILMKYEYSSISFNSDENIIKTEIEEEITYYNLDGKIILKED